MKMKFVIVITLQLLSSFAWSSGSSSGSRGGGDEVAIAFQKSAADGLKHLAAIFPDVDFSGAESLIPKITYITVTGDLPVKAGPAVQDSTAVNVPEKKTVYISRLRWKQINDENLRRAIATHEVLSVAGMEKTGDYHLSSLLNEDNQPVLNQKARLKCTDPTYGIVNIYDVKGDSEAFLKIQFEKNGHLSMMGSVGFDEFAYFIKGQKDLSQVTSRVTQTDEAFKNEVQPPKAGLIFFSRMDFGDNKGFRYFFSLAFGGLMYDGECVIP
jgi:hypothetical protein